MSNRPLEDILRDLTHPRRNKVIEKPPEPIPVEIILRINSIQCASCGNVELYTNRYLLARYKSTSITIKEDIRPYRKSDLPPNTVLTLLFAPLESHLSASEQKLPYCNNCFPRTNIVDNRNASTSTEHTKDRDKGSSPRGTSGAGPPPSTRSNAAPSQVGNIHGLDDVPPREVG